MRLVEGRDRPVPTRTAKANVCQGCPSDDRRLHDQLLASCAEPQAGVHDMMAMAVTRRFYLFFLSLSL